MKTALLVFVIILLAYEYSPIMNAGFVYEDSKWSDWCASATMADYFNINRLPRLLTRVSWCWQTNTGQSVRAFHAVNLGLHLVVTVLVGLLISEVTQSVNAGVLAAALFAVYPMHTESVAYLSGRSELIATIGVLFACLCGLQKFWIGVLTGLTIGILGKESAIFGLPLIPLVRFMRDGLKSGAVALSLASIVTLAIWMMAPQQGAWSWLWVGLQNAAWVRHAAQTIVPALSSVDFNYRALNTSTLVMCGMFSAGVVAVSWRLRTVAPLVSGGLAWMLVAAFPRFALVTPYSILNEHQFYIPRIGALFVVAHAWKIYGEPCRA